MSELEQYDYELPRELIAQQPLAKRDDARLLVVNRQTGAFDHLHVRDLAEVLSPPDCLILNDTRVIPARLVGFRTATQGRWTGLFLETDERGNWLLLSKTRGKLQAGETITLEDRRGRADVGLRMLANLGDGKWAAQPQSDEPALRLLERIGRVPLPPYIRGGEMVPADDLSYQTVFAKEPGAVAAPTAGLHFTRPLLRRLDERGIGRQCVTLHVGPGTFRPIAEPALDQHQMHSEWGRLSRGAVEQINDAKSRGGRIIAVGSTALRVLETAAQSGALTPWEGETRLFIRPPYEFRATDALLTNFHLPRTTLLVLVRTFGGDDLMRRAYDSAIADRYRFYSYGDAMLIL